MIPLLPHNGRISAKMKNLVWHQAINSNYAADGLTLILGWNAKKSE